MASKIVKMGRPSNKSLSKLHNKIEMGERPNIGDVGRAVREDITIQHYNSKLEKLRSVLASEGVNLSNHSPKNRGIPIAIKNYLELDENIDICSPLNVRYLVNQLNKSENFFMSTYGVSATGDVSPKTMIVWRFLGGHVHIIAFCTNNKNSNEKGGGLFMLRVLKRFCEEANIPCITLYALKPAEGYYKKRGNDFIYAVNRRGYVTDESGHKAMVWWNPTFLPGEYNTGLYNAREHDIDGEDMPLNDYVNEELDKVPRFRDFVDLVVQIKRENKAQTIRIDRNTEREKLVPIVSRSNVRERSRDSSSGDEEDLESGKRMHDGTWLTGVSNNQRNYNSDDSEGEEEILEIGKGERNTQGKMVWYGGSRRRKRSRKTARRRKTTCKNKGNKKAYKR